jgi:hypothetical protein
MSRAGAILAPSPEEGPGTIFDHLCERCTHHLELSGAGIVLIFGGEHRGTLGSSDPRMKAVEDLQYTFGEGPCVDANRTGRLVAEPRLTLATSRWPAFAPAAVAVGVAAVFAFPLRIGAARLGAFDLYRDTPGPLSDADLADAALVADAATVLVLAMQAEVPEGSIHDAFADLAEHRVAVHQASGMVSVQLGVGVEDALVAIRASAYQRGVSIGDLADDIVAQRVRLDER